ncbi:hypothetical protein [Leptospira bandrabouensis]|uniref:hypothetical protein n=1 Tax=Leptospira bandrabouensis TaxID=2484903 RepID=UPI0010916775|nr:hypothetical protein [Leptospira bandrabouensis]TGN08589.1 hypothetical protein EHR07_03475 [Leptospira bandrabouensis]
MKSEQEVRQKIFLWFLEKTASKEIAEGERDSLDDGELLDSLCCNTWADVTDQDIEDHCSEALSYYAE